MRNRKHEEQLETPGVTGWCAACGSWTRHGQGGQCLEPTHPSQRPAGALHVHEHALLLEVAEAAQEALNNSARYSNAHFPRLESALDALEANRVPPRPFAAADESVKRCEVCDWPMDREHGCHPGDCAYRPTQGTPEYARIRARRVHLAAQQPATVTAPEHADTTVRIDDKDWSRDPGREADELAYTRGALATAMKQIASLRAELACVYETQDELVSALGRLVPQ